LEGDANEQKSLRPIKPRSILLILRRRLQALRPWLASRCCRWTSMRNTLMCAIRLWRMVGQSMSQREIYYVFDVFIV
jgi:hypothetical protein